MEGGSGQQLQGQSGYSLGRGLLFRAANVPLRAEGTGRPPLATGNSFQRHSVEDQFSGCCCSRPSRGQCCGPAVTCLEVTLGLRPLCGSLRLLGRPVGCNFRFISSTSSPVHEVLKGAGRPPRHDQKPLPITSWKPLGGGHPADKEAPTGLGLALGQEGLRGSNRETLCPRRGQSRQAALGGIGVAGAVVAAPPIGTSRMADSKWLCHAHMQM